MSVVDVAMVGRLGANSLAATGMGAMIFWGALSLVLGIRTSVQTVASRRLGQGLEKESGTALQNGLIMSTLYGLPVSILGCLLSHQVVPFFIHNGVATPLAISYTSIIFMGLLPSAYSFVFQGFYTGIEKPKVHLWVTFVSNTINIYLNVGLIYGTEGVSSYLETYFPSFYFLSYLWRWTEFPRMEVEGAAIATLVASTIMMLHYLLNLFPKTVSSRFKVFQFSVNPSMFKKQIYLALPQGIQETVIAIGWSMFYKIVGIIGMVELATTELLFTIMHASFMPAFGVGQACSTMVSKYMGKKQIDNSILSIKESIRLSGYIMGTIGISFILFPEYYLLIFTDDPKIISAGTFGLRMIGFVQFFDAVGFVLWFALSGAGNTLFPAVVESLLTWIIIVFWGYLLAIKMKMGFYILWVLLPIYMALFTSILIWKIYQGDWKDLTV